MGRWSIRFGEEAHSEFLALGKYSTARVAFESYANKKSIQVIDQEKSNVFAEMCQRQLGNFSYGFDHEIRGEGIMFKGYVDAFGYADGSNFGEVKIEVDGPLELTTMVENAWNRGTEISRMTKQELIKPYVRGKSQCYGLCKRE